MFGRLSAREHLVVTQDGHLLFSTEDLQCAHLKEGGKGGSERDGEMEGCQRQI